MSNRFLNYNNTEDLATEFTLEKIDNTLNNPLDVNVVGSTSVADSNLVELKGVAIDSNSGNLSAQTQRV